MGSFGNILMRIRLATIGLIVLLTAGMVAAEDVRVGAVVRSDTVYAGVPFVVGIVVENTRSGASVDVSSWRAWNPRQGGTSNESQSTVTIINGRRTSSEVLRYVINYELTIDELGRFTLPSVTVEVDGQQYRTRPLTIETQRPSTSDRLGIETQFSELDVYVGQPITMMVYCYYDQMRNCSFDIPVLRDTDDFVIEELELPANMGGQQVELNVEGRMVVGRQGVSRYNNRQSNAIVFGFMLTPRREGVIEVPGASVVVDRAVGRDVWNPQYRRFVADSDGVDLRVRALPSDGRPSDFSGLVGRYEIETLADVTDVSVGDPITLTIAIRGDNLAAVEMPDLAEVAGFTDSFRLPSDYPVPEVEGDRKVFRATIRALNAEVDEIPAISLSYFDVDAGRYFTAYSEPIKLAVATTQRHSSAEAVGLMPTLRVGSLEEAQQGIAANYEGDDLLTVQTTPAWQNLERWPWLLVGGLPVMVFASAVVVRLVGRNDPVKQKARRKAGALAAAKRRVKRVGRGSKDEDAAAVGEALRGYVADKFDRTAQSLTAKDCEELLTKSGVGDDTAARFGQLLQRCESSRFAGSAGAKETLRAGDVLAVLKETERGLK